MFKRTFCLTLLALSLTLGGCRCLDGCDNDTPAPPIDETDETADEVPDFPMASVVDDTEPTPAGPLVMGYTLCVRATDYNCYTEEQNGDVIVIHGLHE